MDGDQQLFMLIFIFIVGRQVWDAIPPSEILRQRREERRKARSQ